MIIGPRQRTPVLAALRAVETVVAARSRWRDRRYDGCGDGPGRLVLCARRPVRAQVRSLRRILPAHGPVDLFP